LKKEINRFYIRYIKYWYIKFLIDRLFTKIWPYYNIDAYDYSKNLHKCTLYYLSSNSIDYTLFKVMEWWGMDMITYEEKIWSKLK
jgi:hypothetical protein